MTGKTYRTTDLSRWGVGQGSNLSATQFDLNFWDSETRLTALEDHPHEGLGISDFVVHGDQMTVVMSDLTVRGPFALPIASRNFRGTWQPATTYFVNDETTINNSVYVVLVDHVSAGSFDPNATDGHGHNLYGFELAVDGALPAGGITGQIPIKTDFGVAWGYTSLSHLSDVAELSPLEIGQLLRWNGTHWANWTLTVTFAEISDIALTSPLDVGQFMRWNGTHWDNEALTPSDVRFPPAPALAASGGATLDPSLGDVFTLTPTAGQTIDAASAPAGAHISIVVTTLGTSSFTQTFGANFKTTGTLATGIVDGKIFTISFVGDGTNLNEVSRTTAM